MRVVVTGASGNLGSALLRALLPGRSPLERAAGHHVTGVVRRPPTGHPYDDADWVALDLASPQAADQLAAAFDGADAVVHMAWPFQPSHDAVYLERVSVGGTRAVIDAVTRVGVPHVVHVSSVGAYSPGPKDSLVDESWPTDGVPSLAYSRHKVAAERMLDAFEATGPATTVTRIRPSVVVQREAGAAMLRYGAPSWLPSDVVRLARVLLPLDRGLVVQLVHADDVAAALVAVLERPAGAFNLAADPPLTADLMAEVLGARAVHVPRALLRAAATLSWRAHLQPLDPGWLDLGFAVPLMDAARARRELGWEPQHDARSVLTELVAGLTEAGGTTSAPLRPRSVVAQLRRAARFGPVTGRRYP